MNLPQIKCKDYKNVMDVAILLSGKEFESALTDMNTFKASGEVWNTNNGNSAYLLRSVHAWVNIDQTQVESKIPSRLGFGRKDTTQDEQNGIYYTMKVNETGEGRTVKGEITYTIVAVMVKGKRYEVKKDQKLPNGTSMETSFTLSYNGKSAKNSTLFGLIRRLSSNGLFQFEKTTHLTLLEPKAAKIEVPQVAQEEKKKATRKPKTAKVAKEA